MGVAHGRLLRRAKEAAGRISAQAAAARGDASSVWCHISMFTDEPTAQRKLLVISEPQPLEPETGRVVLH